MVSVDTRNLKADERTKVRQALYIALARWNRSKIFRFQYGGEIPVRFDPSTGQSTPQDGVARDRWLYLTLVKAAPVGLRRLPDRGARRSAPDQPCDQGDRRRPRPRSAPST